MQGIESTNKEIINHTQVNREPMLLKGACKGWKAFGKWNLNFLREKFGDKQVPVRVFKKDHTEHTLGKVLLRRYIDYIENRNNFKDRYYLADWEISKNFRSLLDDFENPSFFENDLIDHLPDFLQFRRTWIFLGHPEVFTPIHRDAYSTSAWLAQIYGTKRVRIISPEYRPLSDTLFTDQTLLCDKGTFWEFTLHPGDILYIPANYPHEIRNEEVNLMLTRNFLEEPYLDDYLKAQEQRYEKILKKIGCMRSSTLDKKEKL